MGGCLELGRCLEVGGCSELDGCSELGECLELYGLKVRTLQAQLTSHREMLASIPHKARPNSWHRHTTVHHLLQSIVVILPAQRQRNAQKLISEADLFTEIQDAEFHYSFTERHSVLITSQAVPALTLQRKASEAVAVTEIVFVTERKGFEHNHSHFQDGHLDHKPAKGFF